MKRILLLFYILSIGLISLKANVLELPSIFGDNMLIQQKTEAPIWGKAEPGEKVEIISTWGENASTKTDKNGNWKVKLKTPEAGGPYEINIKGNNTEITYENVLIGEVWVCSGQSNMEMPVAGWSPRDTIKNSEKEIKNANFPNIRLFSVSRAFSPSPRYDCKGTWNECNVETVKNFSATAYFFGREIYRELKAPVGLINTSWGGTPAEAWTDKEYLEKVGDFSDFLSNLEKISDLESEYRDWLNSHIVVLPSGKEQVDVKGLGFDDEKCHLPDFDDSRWMSMQLPVLWEDRELGAFDGAVWFRKKVDIPDSWLDKDLILEMGPIDDIDITYFNGRRIGGYEELGYWNVERKYKVSSGLLREVDNTIAVRVIDLQGGGGIYGDEDKMKLYPVDEENPEPINLLGEWKYLPVAEYRDGNFYVFGVEKNDFASRPDFTGINSNSPTVLYNAMIAPIIPYGIKGVIWYQGESNVGRAEQYKKLFPLMIEGWRAAWNQGNFPFYFVQIAPYIYGGVQKETSARLREVQLKTMLSVLNTGMAVTLDIGNVNNIHPANKQDVGRRLALWALAKNYDKSNLTYCGPIYKYMKKEGNKIRLYFDFVGSGLMIKDEKLSGFKISGKNRVFIDAKAYIEDNNVIVYSDDIDNPVAVRYAFTDGAKASLFNKEELPASSFRTDEWPLSQD
jgi:sialate O-acetylesterase